MRDYEGFLPNFSTGFKSASGRRFRRQTGGTDEPIGGCTDMMAFNFNPNATFDDGTCSYSEGCTDYNANNFDPDANVDDGSCEYNMGCTNPLANNYNSQAALDDGSCIFPEVDYGTGGSSGGASSYGGNYIGGCMNYMAQNFNPNADYDDGSCQFQVGCTDVNANNYDPTAAFDNGSCDYSGGVGDLLDELADAAGGPTGGASGGSSGGMVTDSEGFFEKDPKSRQRKKPQNRFSGFAGRDECGFVSSGFEGDVFTEGAPPSQPYIASVASV